MASRVYSELLLERRGAGAGIISSAPVPGDVVWVIRDLSAYANVDAFSRVDVLLRGQLDQGLVYMEWSPGDQKSQHWDGRQVIQPGQHFSVEIGGSAQVDFAISGYALSLP